MAQHYNRETGELWDDETGELVPMPEDEDRKLGAAADEALALTERRLEVERMQQANDVALQTLPAQFGVAIDQASIMNVRLMMLIEYLLGDMDSARRLDYEHVVQVKFVELIAQVESQAARAKLLNGVAIRDPRKL